jgi:hypothetical protein
MGGEISNWTDWYKNVIFNTNVREIKINSEHSMKGSKVGKVQTRQMGKLKSVRHV